MWILQILKEIYIWNDTFSNIQKALVRINPKTLSERLSDLQEWNFILKEIVSMTPLKARYRLTQNEKNYIYRLSNSQNGQKNGDTKKNNPPWRIVFFKFHRNTIQPPTRPHSLLQVHSLPRYRYEVRVCGQFQLGQPRYREFHLVFREPSQKRYHHRKVHIQELH